MYYFSATVVVSLRNFWVKSVVSKPLTPCRMTGNAIAWQRDPITSPPPVSHFKMDAFKLFNKDRATFIEDSISKIPSEFGKRKSILLLTVYFI